MEVLIIGMDPITINHKTYSYRSLIRELRRKDWQYVCDFLITGEN
jgi:hypothetical protein